MNIHVDSAIFQLQSQGGISRLWRSLIPELVKALPEATWDANQPPEWFISTYHRRAPIGVKSLVIVMDFIHERYPLLGATHPDAVDKRVAISEATALAAISKQTADDTLKFCGRQAAVAYPGVDPNFGKVQPSDVQRFQAFIGKPYVMVVGRRGLYKNVQSLYQAWGLWDAHDQYKLIAVGGEDNLPQDAAFAERYKGTWQRMSLDDRDLQLAYAGATALVYPSLMEGFGLPIVEAMACGCPVIVDHSAREVAGGAAIYCEVTRPRGIAAALKDALNPSVRLQCMMAGVQQAAKFRWDAMADVIATEIRKWS